MEDPRAAFSTMAIGGEGGGGEKFNIIPGRYHFTVDRRPIPEESLHEVRAELFAVCDQMRAQGINVRFDTWLEAAPSLTEPDHPGCRVLAQALTDVSGREPRFLLCPGFLDIRHFNARGVPTVACGPGRLEVAHGPEERLAEKDLLELRSGAGPDDVTLLSVATPLLGQRIPQPALLLGAPVGARELDVVRGRLPDALRLVRPPPSVPLCPARPGRASSAG